MERIACKECTSPDCHGCNMYRLEQMLMSGKLDALMNENRTIKMDADVRPVVLCRDCIHCKKGKASLECEKHTYAWNNMRRWVDEDDFCKWGVKKEEN